LTYLKIVVLQDHSRKVLAVTGNHRCGGACAPAEPQGAFYGEASHDITSNLTEDICMHICVVVCNQYYVDVRVLDVYESVSDGISGIFDAALDASLGIS
jgi:hypothetical protein